VSDSEAITRGIVVQVKSQFIPERSDPDEGMWFFAYRVSIINVGEDAATLINRHWIITDGNGEVDEVKGAGVIGEQPLLTPGKGFTYTSACPLRTPVGTMHGTYEMKGEHGEMFDVKIAPFALVTPGVLN
jgi:ApaG protein